MRRTAPAGPLTPKLIKHFAVATVAVTGLLAMFSSGEDWGAGAQTRADSVNNQVPVTQTEQLGAPRLANTIAIRPGPSHGGFDEDPGSDFGERASNSTPQAKADQSVQPRGNHSAPPLGLADAPEATVVVNGGASTADNPSQRTAKTSGRAAPTAQELTEMTANSARRSGQSGEAD